LRYYDEPSRAKARGIIDTKNEKVKGKLIEIRASFTIMMKKNQFNEPLTEKYRPLSLREIENQQEAVMKLRKFVTDLKKNSGKKAAILHGPSGSGKTSLVYGLAYDLGFEIIELNASDFRSKKDIDYIIGSALKQKSLFAKSKIILIDEIDGITGTKDKGGIQALMALIKETKFPILLTANDVWQQKFNSLRQKTELIQLHELNYNNILRILERICIKENIKADKDALLSIAVRARGDVRAAINDLQILSGLGKKVTKKDLLVLFEREKDESIFNAMQLIFKTTKINGSILSVFDNVNLNLDDIFLWLDENLPLEYAGKDLARAYDALSKADLFRGRIRKQQHWRFLVYENILLSAGIAATKSQVKKTFTRYKKPGRVLKIWWANQLGMKKKSISAKLARLTHTSVRRAMKEFHFLKVAIQKNNDLQRELKLTQDEIEFLKK
jgi:replication factor C large subunit